MQAFEARQTQFENRHAEFEERVTTIESLMLRLANVQVDSNHRMTRIEKSLSKTAQIQAQAQARTRLHSPVNQSNGTSAIVETVVNL